MKISFIDILLVNFIYMKTLDLLNCKNLVCIFATILSYVYEMIIFSFVFPIDESKYLNNFVFQIEVPGLLGQNRNQTLNDHEASFFLYIFLYDTLKSTFIY